MVYQNLNEKLMEDTTKQPFNTEKDWSNCNVGNSIPYIRGHNLEGREGGGGRAGLK